MDVLLFLDKISIMHPFGVEYFYSKFWSMVLMPEYLALAGSTFIIILLIKTWMYILTGYKSFGKSVLVSCISNIISVIILISFFVFNVWFTHNLLIFCTSFVFGLLLIDLFIAILFKGKSNLVDGIIGASLGNLIVASIGLIIIILELFPLK